MELVLEPLAMHLRDWRIAAIIFLRGCREYTGWLEMYPEKEREGYMLAYLSFYQKESRMRLPCEPLRARIPNDACVVGLQPQRGEPRSKLVVVRLEKTLSARASAHVCLVYIYI